MTVGLVSMIAFGCQAAKRQASPGPRNQLPTLKTDLQQLIDSAKDNEIIQISPGRYVLPQGLILEDRHDLVLTCTSRAEILVNDVTQNVVTIRDSGRIRLENLLLRHVNPLQKYDCHGDVVEIRASSHITILNCDLNGCGAIGVSARGSSNLTVQNCLIHHNTFNAFYLQDCSNVRIHSNVIEDNANFLQAYGLNDIEACNNVIRRNGGYWEPMDPDPGLKTQADR